MNVINVVHVPADLEEPIAVRPVGNRDLAGMQAFVGGDIDEVRLSETLAMIASDTGMVDGKPYNKRASMFMAQAGFYNLGHGYYGDVFFTGVNEHGEYVTVPENVQQAWVAWEANSL